MCNKAHLGLWCHYWAQGFMHSVPIRSLFSRILRWVYQTLYGCGENGQPTQLTWRSPSCCLSILKGPFGRGRWWNQRESQGDIQGAKEEAQDRRERLHRSHWPHRNTAVSISFCTVVWVRLRVTVIQSHWRLALRTCACCSANQRPYLLCHVVYLCWSRPIPKLGNHLYVVSVYTPECIRKLTICVDVTLVRPHKVAPSQCSFRPKRMLCSLCSKVMLKPCSVSINSTNLRILLTELR